MLGHSAEKGQLWQDSWDKKDGTGQPGQASLNRPAWTGQPWLDSQDRTAIQDSRGITAKAGKRGQDGQKNYNKDRTAGTEQPGQGQPGDGQDSTNWIGNLEHDNTDRIARIGQSGQACLTVQSGQSAWTRETTWQPDMAARTGERVQKSWGQEFWSRTAGTGL
jgi:hypothetical protein